MNIYEGAIVTCDEKNTVHRYLVEDKGRIIYAGDVLPGEYEKVGIVNLGTKALVSAFVDTHTHYSSFALFNSRLMLSSCSTNAEVLELVAAI